MTMLLKKLGFLIAFSRSWIFKIISFFEKNYLQENSIKTAVSYSLRSRLPSNKQLRKKHPYSKFFWSLFSRVRTEYGDLNLHIQSRCGKIRTRKTLNTDNSYGVNVKVKL